MRKEKVEEEPLSPMARIFQLPNIDSCIITMIGFKSKIKLEAILDDLKHNVSKHPRLCSKLSDDGARWINTRVNVEDHVYEPDIDQQEIKEDGESFVNDYVSRLTTIPLDRSIPLWDIHILNVKTSDAEAVGVLRCHHSLGDDLVQISATTLFLEDTETPLKYVQNNPMRFYHRNVSLDDIKLIKKRHEHVTQAALSRYLNGRYGNTDVESGTSTSGLSKLPGRIRLRACIPMNLRQEIGIKPVADMLAKGSKCRWGNYNGFVQFPLSIDLETEPFVNLSRTKAIMDRKKHSLMPALVYSNNEFIFNIFGPKIGAILLKRSVSNTTTTFSNIVGPLEEVSLHGNQITYIALSSYGAGHSQALSIHFISYAEKMIISIGVDPTVIPDPQTLCDEMEDSLKAMKDTLSDKINLFVASHH